MTVTAGVTKITGANYNALQARVNQILGTGYGDTGYGQTLVSSPVSAQTDIVTAKDMNDLLTDINRISVHQTGSITSLQPLTADTDKIAANQIDGDQSKGFNTFSNVVSNLEQNAGSLHDYTTQFDLETATTSTRFAAWNGVCIHSFTVEWQTEAHRRAFFNTGGEIRMSARIEGDNTPKGADWNTILTNMGTIKFSKGRTTKTGNGGTGSGIGAYDLTPSYQVIFERFGQAEYYGNNLYLIKAKDVTSKAIQFRIEFQDNDDGGDQGGTDDLVRGTLTSIVEQLRAAQTVSISVPSPEYTTQSNLSEGS